MINGTSADIFINGEKLSQSMTVVGALIDDTIVIGTDRAGQAYGAGYIADFAIAESLHSDTDIVANCKYLMQKYNIGG